MPMNTVDLSGLVAVPVYELQPGKKYRLTFDFVGKGGLPVTLDKFIPAEDIVRTMKGQAAIVRDSAGNPYFIGSKAFLFEENSA